MKKLIMVLLMGFISTHCFADVDLLLKQQAQIEKKLRQEATAEIKTEDMTWDISIQNSYSGGDEKPCIIISNHNASYISFPLSKWEELKQIIDKMLEN